MFKQNHTNKSVNQITMYCICTFILTCFTWHKKSMTLIVQILIVHSFKKHRTLTLIGEHRTKFILLLNNILNCSSLTHNRSEIWPPYCPFKFKFMGIAFWFTYSSTVLEMKIWINLSKSNALIYSYIVLQKTEKFTGLNKVLLVLDLMFIVRIIRSSYI